MNYEEEKAKIEAYNTKAIDSQISELKKKRK